MYVNHVDGANAIKEDMMKIQCGQFEKVKIEQFERAVVEAGHDIDRMDIQDVYRHIKLPQRATAGSAGYDFYLPFDIRLAAGEGVIVPTGVCVKMEEGWFLACYPRSGLGMKYRLQLDNTVGVIDSDYYGSDNGGQICAKLTNDSKEGKTLELQEGDRFMQGVFCLHGLTYEDKVRRVRNGGMGSTDYKDLQKLLVCDIMKDK